MSQKSQYETEIREDVESLEGLTFRCNTDSCDVNLLEYPDSESVQSVCPECDDSLEEIHPAVYFQIHPLFEIEDSERDVLDRIIDESKQEK